MAERQTPFPRVVCRGRQQHVLATPPALTGNIPGISRAVEQVVFKALAKNPEERYPSVQAFANALVQASQSAPAIGQGAAPLVSTFETGPTQVAAGLQT